MLINYASIGGYIGFIQTATAAFYHISRVSFGFLAGLGHP